MAWRIVFAFLVACALAGPVTAGTLTVQDGTGTQQNMAVEVGPGGALTPHQTLEYNGALLGPGNPLPVTSAPIPAGTAHIGSVSVDNGVVTLGPGSAAVGTFFCSNCSGGSGGTASSVTVTALPSTPPGSNTIGNVGINSALPTGTNTIGTVLLGAGTASVGTFVCANCTGGGGGTASSVTVTALPSTPAGSNTIGNVGINSPIPAGSNTIGQVNIGTMPTVTTVDGGAAITGATMPAGGNGTAGWLSAIWTKLSGTLAISGTVTANSGGTPITGATMPAGGTFGIGWLSAIWTRLGSLTVGVTSLPALPAGTNQIGFVKPYVPTTYGLDIAATPTANVSFTAITAGNVTSGGFIGNSISASDGSTRQTTLACFNLTGATATLIQSNGNICLTPGATLPIPPQTNAVTAITSDAGHVLIGQEQR